MPQTEDKLISNYLSLLGEYQAVSKVDIKNWSHQSVFKEHYFYVHLIEYFAPVFPDVEERELDKLTLICFCYLRGLLGFDRVLDENEHSRFKLGLIHYEAAIKEASAIFDNSHLFWQEHSQFQGEFFSAMALENKIDTKKFDKQSFEKLSESKSAYVKLAISMLCHLCEDFSHQQAINESLVSLHVAKQYLDDLNDFKKDINQQYTYIYQQTCEKLTNLDIDPNKTDVDKLFKYMMLTGLAVEHYQASIEKFDQALSLVEHLDLRAYKIFLQEEIRKVSKLMWATEITVQKSLLSPQFLHQPFTFKQDESYSTLISQAYQQALSFILKSRNAQGLWYTFLTDNGISDVWVSAFILTHLINAGVDKSQLESSLKQLQSLPLSAMSFNQNTTIDADSSTFYILCHYLAQLSISTEKIKCWQSFIDTYGGWKTYQEDSIKPMFNGKEMDCQGWVSSQVCVTAAAAWALTNMDEKYKHHSNILGRSLSYLIKHQHSLGNWPSYWWSSDIYASVYAIKALANKKSECEKVLDSIRQGCQWLLTQQSSEGCFIDAFYTALAIDALLTQKYTYKSAIRKGVQWLLQNQLADGSWLAKPVLRIVQPNVLDSNEVKQWRIGHFGYNVQVFDHQRTFTAATILAALHKFKSLRISLYDDTNAD